MSLASRGGLAPQNSTLFNRSWGDGVPKFLHTAGDRGNSELDCPPPKLEQGWKLWIEMTVHRHSHELLSVLDSEYTYKVHIKEYSLTHEPISFKKILHRFQLAMALRAARMS